MAAPWYCTREDVKRALDVKETARSNAQVDRAIDSASRAVEGRLHRRFYPETATRTFDWPNSQRARPWRLWLDQHELASVTSLVAGGVTVGAGDYLLYPTGGPPYNRVEIDLDSSASFSSGDTHQQAISITGVYAGCPLDEAAAGSLAAAVSTTTATTIDLTDSAAVGVGDVLRVGTERMIVTGRAMLDTGQNIGADLTAQNSAVTVTVADGTAFAVDEVLLVGSERMLVVDIAGNDLTVKRAWDGSVLAAHTSGADVYAPRTLVVERGALGTTAAVHDSGAAITRHLVPGLVRDAAVALALAQLLGEQSGYARSEGRQGADGGVRGSRPARPVGAGAADVLALAYDSYGRKARVRGV